MSERKPTATAAQAPTAQAPAARRKARDLPGQQRRCNGPCDLARDLSEFALKNRTTGRRSTICMECEREAARDRYASNYQALREEDFDVTVANDGRVDKNASKAKRQEYSKAMGELADAVHGAAVGSARGEGDLDLLLPPELGGYVGKLAEQERRFGNRRLARSVALALAHEAIGVLQFKQAAQQYLSGKIQPAGHALKKPGKPRPRTVCLLLSDLHLGSNLSARSEPAEFGALQEARRLEYIVRQAADYKPQYRSQSELLLLLNGDLIEGFLQHDLRDGAPLTEQKVVFWKYMSQALGYLASAYPRVRVVCQPGNHGRDKMRHPGRATSSKWDGHEWGMYYALSMMAQNLRNVTWEIPFRAVSVVDLYGSKLLLTHGDTEVPLGDPDTKARDNANALDRINATQLYGCRFDVAAFGHFHKPRYQPRNPRTIFNGALVPPNGHARTSGWIGEPCGQFLWEAVEGYPVGDVRFVEVGKSQDEDERLGGVVVPFRFED